MKTHLCASLLLLVENLNASSNEKGFLASTRHRFTVVKWVPIIHNTKYISYYVRVPNPGIVANSDSVNV